MTVGEGAEGQKGPGKKNAVLGLKERKVPDAKRSTTPYMTKYERARVLGTRALQIRYVFLYGLDGSGDLCAVRIIGDGAKTRYYPAALRTKQCLRESFN